MVVYNDIVLGPWFRRTVLPNMGESHICTRFVMNSSLSAFPPPNSIISRAWIISLLGGRNYQVSLALPPRLTALECDFRAFDLQNFLLAQKSQKITLFMGPWLVPYLTIYCLCFPDVASVCAAPSWKKATATVSSPPMRTRLLLLSPLSLLFVHSALIRHFNTSL